MADTNISLRGVRVHNLRDVDVDIPLGKITAVSGVSGAGKSSLVFDALHAEAQRRYLQSFSANIRQCLDRLDRPDADSIGDLPPAIAIGHGAMTPGPRATVGSLTEIADYVRLLWARKGTLHCFQCAAPVLSRGPPEAVAFIQAQTAGVRLSVGFPSAPESLADEAAWRAGLREEGFVRLKVGDRIVRLDEPSAAENIAQGIVLVDRFETGKQSPDRLRESVDLAFQRGQGRLIIASDDAEWVFETRLRCAACNVDYDPLEPMHFDPNDPRGACVQCEGTGKKKKIEDCPACAGSALGETARNVFLGGWTFQTLWTASLREVKDFFDGLAEGAIENRVLREEARTRLGHLTRLHLGYLTLSRGGTTLSAGERKRIQLASALTSSLVQALYLFEEPSVGLHPRDIPALAKEMTHLRDAGNTVVLITHDLSLIAAADHVVDLGPGAGEDGGTVVYQGPPALLAHCEASLTGGYLAGTRSIGTSGRPRPLNQGVVTLRGASTHNLKNLTVDFPLGVLCAVTGVSGAGKSSLVQHTLYPALCEAKKKKVAPSTLPVFQALVGAGQIDDVLLMDQEPLPRSARSNAATYLKIFDDIRDLFAETADAKIRNFGPGTFSFNQPGGRCEACAGQGVQAVDMQFLADVVVTCPECHGTRFSQETLKIKVRNLNISEVLNLTVREAFRFFRAQKSVEKKLKTLLDVGLDYLRLGQATQTLSGGECQRLKLAGQLALGRKARCLFLLLEPTASLHPADVSGLLDCLDQLLATGHSVIVVEQNLDVIRNADHIIELGPDAGSEGGCLVAQGTPEEIAKVKLSPTGKCLRA